MVFGFRSADRRNLRSYSKHFRISTGGVRACRRVWLPFCLLFRRLIIQIVSHYKLPLYLLLFKKPSNEVMEFTCHDTAVADGVGEDAGDDAGQGLPEGCDEEFPCHQLAFCCAICRCPDDKKLPPTEHCTVLSIQTGRRHRMCW